MNQNQKNQNQTQNQNQNQNAAAIQDIYEKIHQNQTSKPASNMTHEVRDPHGILDIVASRSRL